MYRNYNDLASDFKYFKVEDEDRLYGAWVTSVGFQVVMPDASYPLKEHPMGYFFNVRKGRVLSEYQLVYITKGKGECSFSNHVEETLEKGKLLLLCPGQWHTYHPDSATGWNEYYIGFDGPLFENIFKQGKLIQKNQILEVGLNEELVSLYNKVIGIHDYKTSYTQQYMVGVLMHIIGLIITINRTSETSNSVIEQKVEQAKIIMAENICKEIEPESLANKLNVSYSWFRKIFKQHTGSSPVKYFNELKLSKAKQMLVDTRLSVKEIAFILGYNTSEYFFAIFKKQVGITPTEYRIISKSNKTEKCIMHECVNI